MYKCTKGKMYICTKAQFIKGAKGKKHKNTFAHLCKCDFMYLYKHSNEQMFRCTKGRLSL